MAALDMLLDEAGSRPFAGWDVGYDGRIISRQPWDFAGIVAEHLRDAEDLLDLDTGGGEWLSGLPQLPARTVAVEAYLPNVAIARARLAPLGVEVLGVPAIPWNSAQEDGHESRYLPFGDACFGLITSRHGSYVPTELARILAPGGLFLTQQVGSGGSDGYWRLLGQEPQEAGAPWTLAIATRQLQAAGFTILAAQEGHDEVTFADVGALAWYLQNLPFICPGFSIADARARLAHLHEAGEVLSVRLPCFWLKARRG